MIFLTWIKTGLRGAIWPGALSGEARRQSPWSWVAHLFFVGGIAAVLAYLNQAWDLERGLRSPWPVLHRVWLPLLFLVVYAALWPLFWLGRLLGSEARAWDFPDIDEAWSEGLQALREAGISLRDTPVYLVLGRPAGSEQALFQAAGMQLLVPEAPARKESPLHLHAHRQGIYVTCSGASLLGRQASHLLETAIHQDFTRQTERDTGRPAIVGSREMIELYAARLRHLCRLIARARAPFCPINGILALIPLAATNDSSEARQTAHLCQVDLQIARDGLRVDCPIYVMICDLEKSPGFGDFLAALPPERRQQALACRFPLVPDLEPAEVPELVAGGVKWLLQAHLPMRTYPLLRLEDKKNADANGGPRNDGLIRFLAQMHSRAHRLARLVARAVYQHHGKLPMLGGVFLAGTGSDQQRGQGFAAEVFQDLAKSQNFVAWTPKALADDSHYRRLSRVAVAGAALLCVLLIAGSAVLFR